MKMADLKRALARLANLDYAVLKQQWGELYGRAPPSGLRRQFLTFGIAYRLQEKARGGLKPATRRYLEQIHSSARDAVHPAVRVRAGTRLIREWHGVTHEVVVLDKEVMFEGKRYRSLSEVAGVITGAKWSGPVFFGLRRRKDG